MNKLPNAAMLLAFDIAAPSQTEHDEWHSHEHLPERLAIPGFVRGSRWRALSNGPGYFVLYEVSELAVLQSPAYLERLNHPSPWTVKMMPAYRGMRRGLCEIMARSGHGLGMFALLLRFGADAPGEESLCNWLAAEAMPVLSARSGLVGSLLLRSGLRADLTVEQRIRGADASVDRALLVTGFSRPSIEALANGMLSVPELERRAMGSVTSGIYQMAHCINDRDLASA